MISTGYSRFSVVSSASYVDVESRTNLHTITGRGSGLRGFINCCWRGDQLMLDPPPQMRFEVPVDRLNSGDAVRDGEMRKFLSSSTHPNIIVELKRVDPVDASGHYTVRGIITVKGKSGEHDGHITVRRDDHRLIIEGSEMIYMRKFGLEPPKILMFQVNAYVRISLRLIAELDE